MVRILVRYSHAWYSCCGRVPKITVRYLHVNVLYPSLAKWHEIIAIWNQWLDIARYQHNRHGFWLANSEFGNGNITYDTQLWCEGLFMSCFLPWVMNLSAAIPGGWPRDIQGNSTGFADFCRQSLARDWSIGPLLHFWGKIHKERPTGFVTSSPSWK